MPHRHNTQQWHEEITTIWNTGNCNVECCMNVSLICCLMLLLYVAAASVKTQKYKNLCYALHLKFVYSFLLSFSCINLFMGSNEDDDVGWQMKTIIRVIFARTSWFFDDEFSASAVSVYFFRKMMRYTFPVCVYENKIKIPLWNEMKCINYMKFNSHK